MNSNKAIREFLRAKGQTTLAEAREMVGLHCDSYTRLRVILKLSMRRLPAHADVLTLLGEEWQSCDDVWQHEELLRILLPARPTAEMMTTVEQQTLAALPDIVQLYRGADRGVNELGLCWSLNREIAARFPFLMRYKAVDPVLVTASVPRATITALKLDRQEMEVIAQVSRQQAVLVETLVAPNRPINIAGIAGAVTLPLNCGSCGGAVTVQYREFNPDDELRPNVYACPWCGVDNAYEAPGVIAWVTKRAEDAGAEH